MFPANMQLECDRHETCGGYCQTLEQYQFSLCEQCLEFDIREVNRQIAITKRREELKSVHRFRSAPTPAISKFPLEGAWGKFESLVRIILKR
jgi:hypothetical protein